MDNETAYNAGFLFGQIAAMLIFIGIIVLFVFLIIRLSKRKKKNKNPQ